MSVVSIPNLVLLFAKNKLFAKLPHRFLVEKLGREGLSRSSYFHYLSTGIVPLPLILKESGADEVWGKATAFCSRSKPPVKIPRKMDSELAYLAGALRDGSVSKRNGVEYTISLFQSGRHSYSWLRKISSIFRSKFGIAPKMEADRDGHRVLIHSKPVALFFESVFEMPKDQRFWATPKIIRELSATEINIGKGYVAGFFDAEGYVTSIETFRKTGKTKLAFYQNNRDSLLFISEFLAKLGLKPHLYRDGEKSVLVLYGKDQLMKFHAHIPILRKKKRLSSLLNSF